jgi:hypothetical protein
LNAYASRRIAAATLGALRWARDHAPPGIRSLAGILLMIGGIFGFLPILGFWMLPLGAAFIALDIPQTRHRIDAWIARLEQRVAKLPQVDPGPRRKGSAKTDAARSQPPDT